MKQIAFFMGMLLAVMVATAQTSLYNKYASNTNIKVACVNNFVLDTGITTDVTILEALDDEGWGWIRNEFSIGSLSEEQRRDLESGQDVFMFTQRDKDNLRNAVKVTGEAVETNSCCYVGVSYLSRSVFVFSCGSEREQSAIVAFMVDKMLRRQEVKD